MKISQYLKEERGEPVFDHTNAEEFAARLRTELKGAEHINVKTSSLGGAQNVSILILAIFDPKPTWVNGIMENSRYMRFHLFQPNIIEQFQMNYKIRDAGVKKFRKARVKSQDDAIKKLNAYFKKVPKYKPARPEIDNLDYLTR
jgi:hypothetical protein